MKKDNFIIQFIYKHKLTYFTGMCFMFLAAYIQTLFPKILGNTIDILGMPNFNKEQIIRNIYLIFIIGILTFICVYAWRNFIIRNARLLECTLRDKLFLHLQSMPMSFFQTRKTGDLIAYAINDISAVRMTLGPATAMSINAIFLFTATIVSMTQKVDWRLTLICLLPIPVVIFIMLKIGRKIRLRFKRVQECFASISDRVQENIYGIRVIKSYVQEEEEIKKFNELNDEMVEANIKMVHLSAILSPTIELCFSISFVLSLIIGGNMVLNEAISLGDFVAFNTYLTMLLNPVLSIGRIINIIQRGMASYRRLDDIFKVQTDIVDGQAQITKKIEGNITIKNLSFTYPNSSRPALNELNFEIKKGQRIGIVGKTGAGKSTLVHALLKLYQVDNGMIELDGVDINDYSLNTLRAAYGTVMQDNFLFSASIKDNITFFKKGYPSDLIKQSTAISCIDETIEQLPKGYETMLGERGVNLSGGQKQRLAIARALIKNPAILILDDSLSAVDSITESNILTHFESMCTDQTIIIIAHKLSSVKQCDLIVVLDEGKIIEQGTHSQLIDKRGAYYEIYIEQSDEFKQES